MTAVDGGVGISGTPCVRPLPAAAAAVQTAGTLWANRTFSNVVDVAVPALHGVLVEQDSAGHADFTVLGRDGTQLGELGRIPRINGVGGSGFTAVDGDHVAFPFQTGAGDDNQDAWTMYLWTASSGKLKAIAHNPTGPSGPLPGGYVHPFFAGHYLYWIQASLLHHGSVTGSELMQYNLTTGTTRVIYNGLVVAGTGYHQLVLFAGTSDPNPPPGSTSSPSPHIMAAVQATGRLTTPPAGLNLGDSNPFQMVSNGDIVVWDSNMGGLRAWRPETGRTFTLIPTDANAPASVQANPNDLAIAGPILAWDGHGDYVMDLRTDTISRLGTTPGTVGGGGDDLAYWLQTPHTTVHNDIYFTYSAYLINMTKLPRLTSC